LTAAPLQRLRIARYHEQSASNFFRGATLAVLDRGSSQLASPSHSIISLWLPVEAARQARERWHQTLKNRILLENFMDGRGENARQVRRTKARSEVAHEGRVQDPYFYVPTDKRPRQPVGLSGSLMLYGRQIFQLCVGTLLVGIDLAERADLLEKFVSNNERYQKISDLLRTETGTPVEKLLSLEPTLRALQRYQFVVGGEVSRGTLISAMRYTAETLIASEQTFAEDLSDALARVNASKREDGEFILLATIKELVEAIQGHRIGQSDAGSAHRPRSCRNRLDEVV
jgi:hypothetical protein